jgi:hypothetical protein
MEYSIKAARTDTSDMGLGGERQSSFSITNPSSRSPRLASALQATIDLESLVTFFAGELREIVPCEGIEYVNDLQGVHIIAGELRRHRCSYTLNGPDRSLGQMVFTRGKRFSKSELAVLETLLSEIFWPLQRALQHRQHRTVSKRTLTDSFGDADLQGRQRPDLPPCAGAEDRTRGSLAEAPLELILAPLDMPLEPPARVRILDIDTSHLSLVTDEG